MKRWLAMVLVLILALACFTACTPGSEESSAQTEQVTESVADQTGSTSTEAQVIKIGFSWPSLVNQAWKSFQEYVEIAVPNVEAESGVDIELTHVSAMTDAAEQNSQVTNLINSGMDVIVIGPWDTTAVWASLEACHEANIPVIEFVRRVTPGGATPSATVGPDTYNSAYIATKGTIEKMIADGIAATDIKMIHTIGDLNDENALYFKAGVEDALKEFSITPIAEIETGWSGEQCLTRMAPVVQANPDVNMIFCCNDDMVAAAQSCLERIDRWAPYGEPNHCYLASQNGDANGIKYLVDGYVDVNGIDDIRGYCNYCVDVAVRLALGEDVDADSFFKAPALTLDNFMECYNAQQIWAADYMTDEELDYVLTAVENAGA